MTTTAPKTTGRPKTSGSERIAIEDSRIYKFLEQHLPQFCVRGRLNVNKLAKAINYSHQGVYHWFSKDRMTPDAAAAVTAVAEGKFTLNDMVQFFVSSAAK